MNYMKEEYVDYFKRERRISLPVFQDVFSLSYMDVCQIIDSYEKKGTVKYVKDFLYEFVEEVQEEKQIAPAPDTPLDELKRRHDEFCRHLLEDLDNVTNEMVCDEDKKHMISAYIKAMPNYSERNSTFGTFFNITYPNGDLFILKFICEDEPYFTDNGLLLKYIKDRVACQGQQNGEKYDSLIACFLENCALNYRNGEVYSNINNSDDEDDLNGEVVYFIKVYEGIFRKIEESCLEASMTLDEKKTKVKENIFLKFFQVQDKNKLEDIALDVVEKVVSIDRSFTRVTAIEFVDEMLAFSKTTNTSSVFLAALEKVATEFRTASDEEYDLLKAEIFE